MPRIYIISTDELASDSLAVIKALLAELGYTLVLLDVEDVEEWVLLFDQENTLLIVIDQLAPGNEALGSAVERVARTGARVVGVWPRDQTDGRLTDEFEKRLSSLVPCERGALDAVLRGRVEHWLTPNGQPRPEPHTPRHGC